MYDTLKMMENVDTGDDQLTIDFPCSVLPLEWCPIELENPGHSLGCNGKSLDTDINIKEF